MIHNSLALSSLLCNFCCCHGYRIQEFKLIVCDCIAIETTLVLNNFPKTNIVISTFLISITIDFYTIFVVAMVTKFKNWTRLCDFIAMETTFDLNNFPKTNICITTFLISIQKWVLYNFVVAMVTKFNNLS